MNSCSIWRVVRIYFRYVEELQQETDVLPDLVNQIHLEKSTWAHSYLVSILADV